MKLNFLFGTKHGLQFFVQVYDPALFWVLKAVALDVLPEGGNYSSSGFLWDSKDFLKAFT